MSIHKFSRLFNILVAVALLLAACVSPTSAPTQSIPTSAPTEAQLTPEVQLTPEAQPTSETQATPGIQTTPEAEMDDEVELDEAEEEAEEREAELEADEEGDKDDEAGQPKITLCHKADRPNAHTIIVAEPALKAHLGHGDTVGPCPNQASVE